jgi:DNA-binding Lrp family transcriptional regulator
MARTIEDAIESGEALLSLVGPFSVSQYARGYGVSRQAASKMLRKLEALGIIEREGDQAIWFKYRAATTATPEGDGQRIGGREFWDVALTGSPKSAYLDLGIMGKARLTKAAQAKAFLRLVKHKECVILDFRRIERVSESFARALLKPFGKRFETINANPSVTAIMRAATWRAQYEHQRFMEQEEAYEQYSPHGTGGL